MASKSKRRGRVFRASCILAALIIAGSSFAWFTTKDEVTNRLSANADYDVSIVESFAPPKNFLPGQEVNKDVYAVNTGTIAAFVRETITSKMTITQEKRVEGTAEKFAAQKDNLIKLTPAERYSVEAGSYLAYAPAGSAAASKVGTQVVAFELTNPSKLDGYTGTNAVIKDDDGNVIGITTDFAPGTADADNGLYVFRRTIKVNDNGTTAPTKDDLRENTEDFTYEAYYYDKGDFYKVMLTSVTGDSVIDLANDGKDTDGILSTTTAPTYNFFKEETKTVTPKLYYDAANHRLVAKVDGFKAGTYPGTLGSDYDAAVDAYEDALIQLYDAIEQYEDMQDTEKEKYLDYISKLIATSKAEQKYVNELNNYNNLKTSTSTALEELKNQINNSGSPATTGDSLEKAAKDLYGNTDYAKYKPDASVTVPALNSDTSINDTYNSATVLAMDCTNWADDTTYANWKSGKPASGKWFEYAEAKHAYEKSIHDEDDRAAADAAFLAELKAYCKTTFSADTSAIEAFTTIEKCAEYLRSKKDSTHNYIDLFVGSVTGDAEKHEQYGKRAALLQAETEYNEAVDLYKTMAQQVTALQTNYVNIKGLREASKGVLYGDADITASATTPKPISTIDGWTTSSDADTDLGNWGSYSGSLYYKYIDAKDKELAAKEAWDDAKGTDDSVDTNTLGAKKAKEDAEKLVADKKADLDKKKMAYEQGTADYNNAGDIIIYVNLNNDTTVGGTKDKWQLVPVKTLDDELTDDTAVFYYTGILQGGETSTKLIDSVKLDKDVTQYMYKSFDFDLDVKMDSAQIAYGSDDITLQATPANEEFGNVTTNVKGANVALADPTDIETALTWTSKT